MNQQANQYTVQLYASIALLLPCLLLSNCGCKKNSPNVRKKPITSRTYPITRGPSSYQQRNPADEETNNSSSYLDLSTGSRRVAILHQFLGNTNFDNVEDYEHRDGRKLTSLKSFLTHLKQQYPEEITNLLNQESPTAGTVFNSIANRMIYFPPDPPHHAINHRLEFLQELTQYGAKPTDKELKDILKKSLTQNDPDLFEFLLTLPNTPPIGEILHTIVENGQPRFIALLEKHVGRDCIANNLAFQNEEGDNVFHKVLGNHNHITKQGLLPLLSQLPQEERKKILNQYNKAGKTPLHLAIEKGLYHEVISLLAAGADAILPTSNNLTPLQLAAAAVNNLAETGKENNAVKAIYKKLAQQAPAN